LVVRLSNLPAGRLLPPGRFLVLISVRGWVDPRAIVRLEGLGQLKKSTSSWLESVTFRLIAVPQLPTVCTLIHISKTINYALKIYFFLTNYLNFLKLLIIVFELISVCKLKNWQNLFVISSTQILFNQNMNLLPVSISRLFQIILSELYLYNYSIYLYYYYCHVSQWLKTGLELVIRFISHLQLVTTIITLLLLYTIYNYSTLTFSVYFHWSSVPVSWQLVYNTETIKVSLNHTLPTSMYYCTHKIFKITC
jgi:hypothetical protein